MKKPGLSDFACLAAGLLVFCAVTAVPYLPSLPSAGIWGLQIAGVLLMLFLASQFIRRRAERASGTKKRPAKYEGLFIFVLFLGGAVILLASSAEELSHTLLIASAALIVRYALHAFNRC